MEGRVNVFARVRGVMERESGSLIGVQCDEENKSLTVEDLEGAVEASLLNKTSIAEKKSYEFDGVFGPDSNQADVFKAVGLPVMNAALRGLNGCVFAYGMTSSGKTFSLLNSEAKQAGLLPRLVATLYARASFDRGSVYLIEAAALQVYNEQVDDLLHADYMHGCGRNLAVSKGVAEKATWTACSSSADLMELFAGARKNIIYAETKMNKASSRSHALFQLRISKRSTKGVSTRSVLSVVDLAGSERVKRSGVEGAQFKEAVAINGSLLALGQVISALAARKKHVPFRDSKLTRLLETSLGGNCVTTLLACASPSADSTSETISAFAFAQRAMRVEVAAVVNEVDLSEDFGALSKSLVLHNNNDAQRLINEQELKTSNELKLKKRDEDSALALKKMEKEAREQLQKEQKTAAELTKALTTKHDEALSRAEAAKKAVALEGERKKAELEKSIRALETQLATGQKEDERRVSELKTAAVKLEKDLAKSETALQTAQASAKKAEAAVESVKKEFLASKDALQKEHAGRLLNLVKQHEQALAARSLELNSAADATSEKQAVERAVELKAREQAQAERQVQALKAAEQEHAAALGALNDRHSSEVALSTSEKQAADARAVELERDLEVARGRSETALAENQKAVQNLATELKEHSAASSKKVEELSGSLEVSEKRRAGLQETVAKLNEALQTAQMEHESGLLNLIKTKQDLTEESKRAEALQGHLLALEERSTQESLKFEAFRARSEQLAFEREQEAGRLEREHAAYATEVAERHRRASQRQASVFSAARHVESLKRQSVEERLDDIVHRFEARISRDEDVKAINGLRSSLGLQARTIKEKEREAQRIRQELDHERATDRIFGVHSKKQSEQPPTAPASSKVIRPRTGRRALNLNNNKTMFNQSQKTSHNIFSSHVAAAETAAQLRMLPNETMSARAPQSPSM